MSGAETAALVLGLISASISIIDATAKLYDAAHDAKGLPAAFREVAARMPLVLEILKNAEEQLKAGKVKESTCQAVQPVMEQCNIKLENLSTLFKKVLPEEGATRFERYRNAARMLGKGGRVEELMLGILADVQLLAENRSMGAATEEQFKQLLSTIEEIKNIDPSLPDESESFSVNYTGSGQQWVAAGSARQYNNPGSGNQYNYSSEGGSFQAPTYNAPVNQYHDNHKAFGFYEAQMMVQRIENLYISSDRMDEPQAVYKMVPARNENFVVRENLDQELMKILPFNSSGSIAIWGLGGCGKTQIALNYAYRRHEATNCSIFWIRADSEDVFIGSYGDIAKEANLPETLTGNDKLRAVRKWVESQSSWLVIVDNADDLDESRSQCLKYVPRHQACSKKALGAIIWTTRDRKIMDLPFDISRGIDASAMQRSDSLRLYRALLHHSRSLSPDEYTQPASEDEQALLHELDDLPLAISQAAAYIRTDGDIRNYVDRLRDSESEASRLLLRDQRDPYRHARQNSVMKTWLVSLTRLKEEKDVGKNAVQILYFAAFLDNQGITFELLQYSMGTDIDQYDLHDAVARLVEYSFLQLQGEIQEVRQIYSQHKLFSMAMRHHLTSEGSRSTYAAHTFSTVLQCFPSEQHETSDRCRLYLPHAHKVLGETGCTGFQELADQLLQYVATSYIFHGRYHEAKVAIKQLIDLQVQSSSGSIFRRLEAQSVLGWVHILQGQFAKAEKILTSTLESQTMMLEENHPSIWMTKSNLARAVQKIGEYNRAEALQLAILEYHKQNDKTAALDALGAMNNLGLTYRYQGRLTEAEDMFKKILEGLGNTSAKRPYLALGAQNNLALVFRDQGALDKSEKLLDSTIEESKDRLGNSHPDTVIYMHSLFSVYIKQGRTEDAKEIGSRVEGLTRTVLGNEHPMFLSISHDLRMLNRSNIRSHADPRDSIGTTVITDIISNQGYIVSNLGFISNSAFGSSNIPYGSSNIAYGMLGLNQTTRRNMNEAPENESEEVKENTWFLHRIFAKLKSWLSWII